MIIEVESLWFVPLVFVPFVLGLLTGIRVTKEKITMKLAAKLPVDVFESLMEK